MAKVNWCGDLTSDGRKDASCGRRKAEGGSPRHVLGTRERPSLVQSQQPMDEISFGASTSLAWASRHRLHFGRGREVPAGKLGRHMNTFPLAACAIFPQAAASRTSHPKLILRATFCCFRKNQTERAPVCISISISEPEPEPEPETIIWHSQWHFRLVSITTAAPEGCRRS